MASDPSDDRIEERARHAQHSANADPGDATASADGAAKTARRGARPAHRPKPAAKRVERSEAAAHPEADDPGERLREQAAEVLAATRERIVERPLQAVLVAAAAGAAFALLFGAARR